MLYSLLGFFHFSSKEKQKLPAWEMFPIVRGIFPDAVSFSGLQVVRTQIAGPSRSQKAKELRAIVRSDTPNPCGMGIKAWGRDRRSAVWE